MMIHDLKYEYAVSLSIKDVNRPDTLGNYASYRGCVSMKQTGAEDWFWYTDFKNDQNIAA
jgi:hypothetical protein